MKGTGELEPGDIPGEATPEQWQKLIAILGSEIKVRQFAAARFFRSITAPLLAVEAAEMLYEPEPPDDTPTLRDIADTGLFGLDK